MIESCGTDGWYDTGSTRWVAPTLAPFCWDWHGDDKEIEQKEQRYWDAYCSGGSCTGRVTGNPIWVATGNERAVSCPSCQWCEYGNCVEIDCGTCKHCSGGSCVNDACGTTCPGGRCDGSGTCRSTLAGAICVCNEQCLSGQCCGDGYCCAVGTRCKPDGSCMTPECSNDNGCPNTDTDCIKTNECKNPDEWDAYCDTKYEDCGTKCGTYELRRCDDYGNCEAADNSAGVECDCNAQCYSEKCCSTMTGLRCCAVDEICCDDGCRDPECESNSGCDDNDKCTDNICSMSITDPCDNKCTFPSISGENLCGTYNGRDCCNGECCALGDVCYEGNCVTPACNSDIGCVGDKCNIDGTCINQGEGDAYCSYTARTCTDCCGPGNGRDCCDGECCAIGKECEDGSCGCDNNAQCIDEEPCTNDYCSGGVCYNDNLACDTRCGFLDAWRCDGNGECINPLCYDGEECTIDSFDCSAADGPCVNAKKDCGTKCGFLDAWRCDEDGNCADLVVKGGECDCDEMCEANLDLVCHNGECYECADAANALSVPTLRSPSSPSNGAINVPLQPTFEWDEVSGADRYLIKVEGDGYSEVRYSDSTSYKWPDLIALTPGVTYSWSVRSCRDCQNTQTRCGYYSSSWSFSTTEECITNGYSCNDNPDACCNKICMFDGTTGYGNCVGSCDSPDCTINYDDPVFDTVTACVANGNNVQPGASIPFLKTHVCCDCVLLERSRCDCDGDGLPCDTAPAFGVPGKLADDDCCTGVCERESWFGDSYCSCLNYGDTTCDTKYSDGDLACCNELVCRQAGWLGDVKCCFPQGVEPTGALFCPGCPGICTSCCSGFCGEDGKCLARCDDDGDCTRPPSGIMQCWDAACEEGACHYDVKAGDGCTTLGCKEDCHCNTKGQCVQCIESGQFVVFGIKCCTGKEQGNCISPLGRFCVCTWPSCTYLGASEIEDSLLTLAKESGEAEDTYSDEGYYPFVCESQIMEYLPGDPTSYHCVDECYNCKVDANIGFYCCEDGVQFNVPGSYDGWYCCPEDTLRGGTMQPTPADCNAACVEEGGDCVVGTECCQKTDIPPYAFDQYCTDEDHCCKIGSYWDGARCIEADECYPFPCPYTIDNSLFFTTGGCFKIESGIWKACCQIEKYGELGYYWCEIPYY